MEFFSTFDLEKILEIKRTRLQEWINRGFIIPSQASDGQGSKALFSREDLYGVKLFSELLNMGLNRYVASRAYRWVMCIPMQIQEKSVDWGKDYFNICIPSLRKIKRSNPDDYLLDYGEPGLGIYTEKNKKSGETPLLHIVVNLKIIKQDVDRRIG